MRLLILPLMVGALCAADQTAGKSGGSPITATGTHPSAYPLLIGDTIPTTLPMTMLQGDPIKEFKPGEVYVLECWSDFSNLLSEARIPHLDALHRKMGPKGVVIIGVNVSPGDRSKEQTLAKAEEEVRNYIKHQGKKMSYRVALDGNKFISDWLERSEAQGLLSDNDGTLHTTHTFIVKDGKLVWQGHSWKVTERMLSDIVEGTFVPGEASHRTVCPTRISGDLRQYDPTERYMPKVDLGHIDRVLKLCEEPKDWSRHFEANYHEQFMAINDAIAAKDWERIQAALDFIPVTFRNDVVDLVTAHQARAKGDSSLLIALTCKYALAEENWNDWQYLESLARIIMRRSDCDRALAKLAEEFVFRARVIWWGTHPNGLNQMCPRINETIARAEGLSGSKVNTALWLVSTIQTLEETIKANRRDAEELKSQLESYKQGKTPEPRSKR